MTFDESSFKGRFNKYLELTNVRHLFHRIETIQRCQHTLKAYPSQASENCKAIVAACVNPTTEKVIPVYGRLASFVPVNIPICSGMLLAAPTLVNIIGWQWFNQSYNAIFNYCNSAKSDSTDENAKNKIFQDIAKGYGVSVGVSVGLAVGLTQWLKKAQLSPSTRRALQAVVPYTATASASMANVIIMRNKEMSEGIPVRSASNEYIGHSKIAGKQAVFESAFSRAVLSIPILLLPPPVLSFASKWSVIANSKLLRTTLELNTLIAAIAFGLPAAIALYPQNRELDIKKLEEPLKRTAMKKLGSDEVVYFNKGV